MTESVILESLPKVEYAQESVERGSIAVGIKGANCIVLGTEKKSQSSSLMMGRTMSKICFIDRKGEFLVIHNYESQLRILHKNTLTEKVFFGEV